MFPGWPLPTTFAQLLPIRRCCVVHCMYSGDKKTALHYAADKHAGADVVSEMLGDANPTTKLLWLIGAYHTATEEKLPEVREEADSLGRGESGL